MEASVLFPEESVTITVMVVVAPDGNGVASGIDSDIGRSAPEPPDPDVVPLVTLFCLLISELSHPGKIKRAALTNKNKKIEEKDL